jgi:integrase
MKVRLTDLSVRSLAAPATGTVTYFDDAVPGLGLRVSAGGTRAYTLVFGPSRTRTAIGRVGVISLKDARTKAKAIVAQRTLGAIGRQAPTFEVALADFEKSVEKKNKGRTAKETMRLLKKHFLPPWRHSRLDTISPSTVSNILDRMKDTPSEANHAFAAIRLFFNWAVRREVVAKSPCTALQAPSSPVFRDRVLTDKELRKVLTWTKSERSAFSAIVQLLILTGQRRGEIGALEGSMVDFPTKMITLPSRLTKNNREHRFPFGTMAEAILREYHREGFLFPAGATDNSFSAWSKSKTALDKETGTIEWTLHDLRRSFATRLAALGTPIHVTEKLLNHVTGTISGVAAIYNRHAYMDEMRHAIEAYEAHLATLTGS